MKFISDGMLGKLTRWLRMIGYDAKYSNKLDDAKLIVAAENEARILLTKDLNLCQRAMAKKIGACYLEGKTEEEKLAELAERFNIKLDMEMMTSRCPKCNTPVEPISKAEAMDRVASGTFIHYERFWKCPNCSQIYWQGAHWRRIRETLRKAQKILETSRNSEREQSS